MLIWKNIKTCRGIFPTNTPRVFHIERTWKRVSPSFQRGIHVVRLKGLKHCKTPMMNFFAKIVNRNLYFSSEVFLGKDVLKNTANLQENALSGNDGFHIVSTWNTRGPFEGFRTL